MLVLLTTAKSIRSGNAFAMAHHLLARRWYGRPFRHVCCSPCMSQGHVDVTVSGFAANEYLLPSCPSSHLVQVQGPSCPPSPAMFMYEALHVIPRRSCSCSRCGTWALKVRHLPGVLAGGQMHKSQVTIGARPRPHQRPPCPLALAAASLCNRRSPSYLSSQGARSPRRHTLRPLEGRQGSSGAPVRVPDRPPSLGPPRALWLIVPYPR